MIKEKHQQTIRTMEKTLALLELLAAGDSRLTIHELSCRINCSHHETLLLLITMESRGLVEWDEHKKIYRLGTVSERLAWKLLSIMGNGNRSATDSPRKRDKPAVTDMKNKRQVKPLGRNRQIAV